ncbi:hypothetical protein KAJ27_10380, partial [bacterium]|nr:hypothetical protein [bacterium]
LVDKQLKLIKDEKSYYSILKATGSLPFGNQGELEYDNIAAVAAPVIETAKDIASKKQLPSFSKAIMIEPGEVTIDSIKMRVFGRLSYITEDGAYNLTYGKLNGSRVLTAWIKHLFLNIASPDDYPNNTIVIGRDPNKKTELLKYLFSPLKAEAQNYLDNLCRIYLNAEASVFFFACETSWQVAQFLKKNDFGINRDMTYSIMNNYKVRNAWYGGQYQTGEIENPYLSLCLKNNNPFENPNSRLAYEFIENSLNIYKPLIENMT